MFPLIITLCLGEWASLSPKKISVALLEKWATLGVGGSLRPLQTHTHPAFLTIMPTGYQTTGPSMLNPQQPYKRSGVWAGMAFEG